MSSGLFTILAAAIGLGLLTAPVDRSPVDSVYLGDGTALTARALADPPGQSAPVASVTEFKAVLSKSIDAAEDDFDGIQGAFQERILNSIDVYSCKIPLSGFQTCQVFAQDNPLKNFVVWSNPDGMARETAEQLFAALVATAKEALPTGWSGRETPSGDLSPRELREFVAYRERRPRTSAHNSGRPARGSLQAHGASERLLRAAVTRTTDGA